MAHYLMMVRSALGSRGGAPAAGGSFHYGTFAAVFSIADVELLDQAAKFY
jgi:hypothetical protein